MYVIQLKTLNLEWLDYLDMLSFLKQFPRKHYEAKSRLFQIDFKWLQTMDYFIVVLPNV